jgi:hypothetical protein
MAKKSTKADKLAADKLITDFRLAYEKERTKKCDSAKDIIAGLCEELFLNLVDSIQVGYNGEGDSGDISYLIYFDVAGEPAKYKLSAENEEKLRDACFNLLPSGFEINDGGFGVIKIDIRKRVITVEHSTRIVQTEDDTYAYAF